MPTQRTLLLIHNRADPTGQAPLDDLAGAGGRMDVVTRFVTSSLLTSHGIREETTCIVFFTNTVGEPKALKVPGAAVTGLRPDERTAASKLNQALAPVGMPVWQDAGEGMETRTCTLEQLLDEVPAPLYVLDEDGEDVHEAGEPTGTFVFGDDQGLTDEQATVVGKRATGRISLGPVSLQADQAVTVLHNALDRQR